MNGHSFPSAKNLLSDLVGIESWTRKGQDEIARYIEDFAKRWELGDVRRVGFPASAEFADEKPKPSNIMIQTGSQKPDEIIVFHGHFDTVYPDDYPEEHKQSATQLHQSDTHPNVYHGIGAYDMKAGVTAILRSLHNLSVAHHRQIRAILVCGEENYSEGTHAALHHDDNLFRDARGVVSTEITVGTHLGDNRYVLIGRPGRVGLHVKLSGAGMHAGSVTRDKIETLLSAKMSKALDAITDIRLTEHPSDPLRLMGESMCVPTEYGSERVRALSAPSRGFIDIDVHYCDPRLGPAEIEAEVKRALIAVLGPNFEIERTPGRRIRFTDPWLEQEDAPFIRRVRGFAENIQRTQTNNKRGIKLIAGKGVADEGVIAHSAHIPVICIPPDGDGEHTRNERVNVDSITSYQEPVLRRVAAYEGSLFE